MVAGGPGRQADVVDGPASRPQFLGEMPHGREQEGDLLLVVADVGRFGGDFADEDDGPGGMPPAARRWPGRAGRRGPERGLFRPPDRAAGFFLTLPQSVAMPVSMILIRLMAAFGALWLLPAFAQILAARRPAARPVSFGEAGKGAVYLSAVLAQGDVQPIRSGGQMAGFSRNRRRRTAPTSSSPRSDQPTPQFTLPDGGYIAHAAFGLAGASRRVKSPASRRRRLVLNAGGLKVVSMLGDTPVAPEGPESRFSCRARQFGNQKLVLEKGRPGDIVISLPKVPTINRRCWTRAAPVPSALQPDQLGRDRRPARAARQRSPKRP